MKVIQIDERDGISEEILARNEFTHKIERMNYCLEDGIELGIDLELKWVEKKIKECYLSDKPIESEIFDDD